MFAAATVAPQVPKEPIVRRARTSSVALVPAVQIHRRAGSVPPVQADHLARAPSIARIASTGLIARNVAARHEAASIKAVRRAPQAAATAVTSRLATARLALPGARGVRPGAAAGPQRFSQDRPGRPPRDAGRPARSFTGGEGRGASRPDRPFGKPRGDRPYRPTGGPRRFEGRPPAAGRPGAGAGRRPGPTTGRPGGFSRPPRRDGESRPPFRSGESRPQGDRPFKRPYSSAGNRPPGRGPARSFGKSAGGDRPQRNFTPRPRPEGGDPATRPEGGERESRPFRPAGQRPSRPGGFSKPAGRSGSFRKPAFGKPGTGKPGFSKPGGYRKPAAGQSPAGEDSGRPPRSSFASGPRKPGGFRKPGAPGKSFGKPRPAGAPSGRPRPGGAGKGRTSTTTSSGMPRPGAGGKPRTGKPGGRPPAKGGFKSGGFKPGGKRPGGSAPPHRKPRGESREGDEG